MPCGTFSGLDLSSSGTSARPLSLLTVFKDRVDSVTVCARVKYGLEGV